MSNVSKEYLRDENNEIFSPIVNQNYIVSLNGKSFSSYIENKAELIFSSRKSNIPMSAISFKSVVLDTVEFDKYNMFKSSTGYVFKESGIYQINIRAKLAGLVGDTSKTRNVNIGFCINNKAADAYGKWMEQLYDRCSGSYSNIVEVNAGDSVQFQYYCDGSTANKIDDAELFITKLPKSNYNSSESLSVEKSNAKVEYLRNENNEIISPIVSSSSVYNDKGINYDKAYKNNIILISCFNASTGKMNPSQTINYNTSLSYEKVYTNFHDSNYIELVKNNGIPLYKTLKDGYYIIGVAARLYDAPGSQQDYVISIGQVTNYYPVCAGRATYRMGRKWIYMQILF